MFWQMSQGFAFLKEELLAVPHAFEVLWALQLRALCAHCDATASAAISWGHCAWSPAEPGWHTELGSSTACLGQAHLQALLPCHNEFFLATVGRVLEHMSVSSDCTYCWVISHIQILGVFSLSHHHRVTSAVSMQSLGHWLQSRKVPLCWGSISCVLAEHTTSQRSLEGLAVSDSSSKRLKGWTIYFCFLLQSTQIYSVILFSLIIPFLIPSCQLNQPNSTWGRYFLFHNCLTVFPSLSSWQFFPWQISERKAAHFTGNSNCFPEGFVYSAFKTAETKQADLSWQNEEMEVQAIHFMDSSLRTINAFWLCLSHCQQPAFSPRRCC